MPDEIILQPIEGRYDTHVVPGYILDPPPFGTEMTEAELAKCADSDDIRFSNNSPANYVARQIFKFDLSSYSPGAIKTLKPSHEGYSTVTGEATAVETYLSSWRVDSEEWRYQDNHSNGYDTVIEREAPYGGPAGGNTPDVFISDAGELWILIYTYDWSAWRASTLYTDQVQLVITLRVRVASSTNPFGQRFRAFDDGDVGDISFERLDHPGADWSIPTQPFSGDGNANPDLVALPTGALRAGYLDSDGDLQQRISLDDGETWNSP